VIDPSREALLRISWIEPWKRGAATRMNRIAREALRHTEPAKLRTVNEDGTVTYTYAPAEDK
jgi:hypothetical protein